LGKLGAVLVDGFRQLKDHVGAPLLQILQQGISANFRHRINIACLGVFVERLLFQSFALRIGKLLVQIRQPLGGDVDLSSTLQIWFCRS